jgi:hypothetical protein
MREDSVIIRAIKQLKRSKNPNANKRYTIGLTSERNEEKGNEKSIAAFLIPFYRRFACSACKSPDHM